MAFRGWDKVRILTDSGEVEGIAPLIISASRATDIPAFHADWLIERLRIGYSQWINPFNRKSQYVSFGQARVIVFWTKNPLPLLRYLSELDQMRLRYYFLFTLNDYDEEGWEPGVPPLSERVAIFQELSQRIGKQKVIWRFDPILLAQQVSVDSILGKIMRVGEQLYTYTEKLVFSFADVGCYAHVSRNLRRHHIDYQPVNRESIVTITAALGRMAKEWNIKVATCAEDIDLSVYGIDKNRCIDDELMARLFKDDTALMKFLGYQAQNMSLFDDELPRLANLKDNGQRQGCNCIASKDIGHYNTCLHLCRYCYANTSEAAVRKSALCKLSTNAAISQEI